MLKVFRDNLKSLIWILWVVIAIFVLYIFTDFGSSRGANGGVGAAATVGGESVSFDEFKRVYQRVESQYRQSFGEQFTPELAKQMRLPVQVLDQLVNQKILLAEAERLGLEASDAEVRDLVLSEPGFKDEKGQFIGQEAYTQMLRASEFGSPAQFESLLREQILLDKLNQILAANVYVSDKDIEKAYRDQVERAKIRYVQLPRSRVLQAATAIPPAELQAYFQAHKEEFRLPEQRQVAYLLVDAAKLQEQAKVSDADLQKYYEEHKEEFSQEEQVRARHILVMVNDQRTDEQARQRIEEARKRIAGGADFAAVAKEVSDDTASKVNGGDLGYFGRKAMVQEFSDAAFGAQTGQMVGPVKSTYGYHLIEVTDRRPGGQLPFDQARPQIQARLSVDQVRQLAETRAKDIAARLAKDKPKSAEALKTIATENPALTFGSPAPIGQNDSVPELGYSPAFASAAFALEKGGVSEPVQVPRGWAVLYLQDILAPRAPELKDVEPRVRAAAVQQRAQKLAVEQLNAARAGGKSLDQVAAALGLEVKESAEFGANGSIPGLGFNPELAKAALALQNGQTGGPVADTQGAVLFQVTERKAWDPAEFAKTKEQTRASVQQEKLMKVRAALIEQRRRELGVEYDRQLLESFGMTGDATQPG